MTNSTNNNIQGQMIIQGEELLAVPNLNELVRTTRNGKLYIAVGIKVKQENSLCEPIVSIELLSDEGNRFMLPLTEVRTLEPEFVFTEHTDTELNDIVNSNAQQL